MKETWAFDIGSTKFYSTKRFKYGAVTYLAKILPESFTGVSMRVDLVSKLYAPNTAEFDISNLDGTLAETDFQDQQCRIGQVLDGVLCRQWNLVIETAVEGNGKIHCVCTDVITRKLKGDFPNTPTVAGNHPSDQVYEDKDARVPITLGTAFIPITPFLDGGVNYYCLGKTGSTYTINKVRSPRNSDFQEEWDNSYSYPQSNITGEQIAVKGCQLVIAPNPAGAGFVPGVFNPKGTMQQPLIQFSGPLATTHYPGRWIKELLQMFGVDISFLDTTSFDAARNSVSWGGGFWKTEAKETILSSLLSQCDCFLSCEATLKLNEFVKTPIESIDASKVQQLSFSPSKMTKSETDGGTVRFAWDGEPQDELTGEAVVGLYGSQTTVNDPSGEVFEYKYGYDNTEAQAFGVLAFQKKFDQKYTVSFSTTMDKLTSRATIIPGKVITLYHITADGLKLYGASKDVVITSIQFKPGLDVVIEGTVYNHLEQYSDLSPAEIVPETDGGTDFIFNSVSKIVTVSGCTAFHYAAGETVPTPASCDLTATLYGGLAEYLWQYFDGADWQNLSGTIDASTYTLAYDNAAWGTATFLRVRCLSGVYYGEMTITKVTDGAAGVPGSDGVDGAAGADGIQGPGNPFTGYFGLQWTWPKVFYNNQYRRDLISYGGAYYIFAGVDGHSETSWNAAHWQSFGGTYESVATDILLARDVTITRSLTFSGGASFLNITGANGLVINSVGGLKIVNGADIYMLSGISDTARLVWQGQNYKLNIGCEYTTDTLCFWHEQSAGTACNLTIGRVAGVGDRKFQTVNIKAYNQCDLSQSDSTGSSRLFLTSGNAYIAGSQYINLNTPYLRPYNATVNLGSTTYRFNNLFLWGNIGGTSQRIGTLYCTAISANGALVGVTDLTINGNAELGNGTADAVTIPGYAKFGPRTKIFASGYAHLYGFASTYTELRCTDSAGNETTLSPHTFELFTPDKSYKSPWAYYSNNDFIGTKINVDMYGAISEIEKLSGKKFIYTQDYTPLDWDSEQLKAKIIKDAEISEWQANQLKIKAEADKAIADWEADTKEDKPPKPDKYVIPEPPKSYEIAPTPAYIKTILDEKKKGK